LVDAIAARNAGHFQLLTAGLEIAGAFDQAHMAGASAEIE
jgi:hypothetical protein